MAMPTKAISSGTAAPAGTQLAIKTTAYIAEFNGNGHTISNLYINRSGGHVALFAEITGSGFIHHVGLLNVNITGGGWTAALVGHLNTSAGAVSASYATGQESPAAMRPPVWSATATATW